MKAHKITLLVVDFENTGEDDITTLLETQKYVNGRVMKFETADIGKWFDDHPLNDDKRVVDEMDRLFPC